ncbi:MAG TPA: glutamine--fructose-6-phosphate transaminase (isomerizing), partial [archaeon]|nr:glutamine--fructose-6-phosphate transaminase (isomerizing) [archaeon]
MCGIIGYIGNKGAAPILLDGLKRLEYRGYDSAGILTINGNDLEIKKDVGKIEEIHSKLNFLELQGNIGIAHTRWATHGNVTKENAHPHISNNGKIAVVHNGIIENFQDQHRFLTEHGFSFHSST